jgi:biopolymer transport protein ExbB
MDRKVRTLLRLLTLPMALLAAMLLAGAAGYAFKANLVAQPAAIVAAAQSAASAEPSPASTSPAATAPQPTAADDESAELAGQPDANEAAEPADAADSQPETDTQPDTTDPGDGD